MKDMFKEMVKEMTSTNREKSYGNQMKKNSDDIFNEEKKEDKEMDILSSDEDADLYSDQETSNGRRSLRAHKKKTSSKRKKTSDRRSKRFK